MASLRAGISAVVEENAPITVRQVFYQLVSRGAIAKNEAKCKSTVVLRSRARRSLHPFGVGQAAIDAGSIAL